MPNDFTDKPSTTKWIIAALALLALLAFAHIWSLWDGTVLDDYWHQKGLREHGWSLSELIRTTRIEPADFVGIWWQNQTMAWEYARPVFILFMKVLYHVIGNDNPMILHAASLVLHYLSTLLVVALAFMATQRFWWSVGAGAVFVIYHHAVMTVQWPSAQNVVMFVFFSMLIIHAYIRASQLDIRVTQSEPGRPGPTNSGVVNSTFRWNWFAFAAIWWLIALFTRENAVLIPGFLIALDVAYGGFKHAKKRIAPYAFFAIAGIAFVIWRMTTITQPIPEVYARLPAGEGIEYPLWLIAKYFHYLATSVYLIPMTVGPTARYNPWVEAPFDTFFTVGLVLLFAVVYWAWARNARGWWVWPLWILLMMVPVLPVVATPHTGYMSGLAFAMMLAIAGTAPRLTDWRRYAAASVMVLYFLGASFFSLLARWQWTGLAAAEQYAIESVKINPPPPTARDVYFINLPFANVYLKPGLDLALGADFADVRCHVLVYAPEPVEINEPVIIEQTDPNSITVTAVGEPFFAGLLGRFLFESFRDGEFFTTGDQYETPEFTVEILAADLRGVSQLAFTFAKPLNDPSHSFYVSAIETGPTRLRFAQTEPPAPSRGLRDSDVEKQTTLDKTWINAIENENLRAVLRSHAAPLQNLPGQKPPTIKAIRTWAASRLDPAAVAEREQIREELAYLVKLREEVPHSIMWAKWFFESDLYLSGSRFPRSRAELNSPAFQAGYPTDNEQ